MPPKKKVVEKPVTVRVAGTYDRRAATWDFRVVTDEDSIGEFEKVATVEFEV